MKRILFILITLFTPFTALASSFSVSAWIPYATESKGIPTLLSHMQDFTEINPFVYDITSTSTLTDEGGVSTGSWNSVFSTARANGIKIIPTIIWGNKDQIQAMLSSTSTRATHVTDILSIVNQNNFDGVDIDYEAKYVASKDLFSQFLADLSNTLHKNGKILSCTIEARTSDSSASSTPATALFPWANDYAVIGNICDEVRLMAYDDYFFTFGSNSFTTTTPLTLAIGNAPIDFDKAVIAYAEKYISPVKIIIGIPTYGYDFSVTIKNGLRTVKRYATYSYTDAIAKAQSTDSLVHTTPGGEKYFIYYVGNTTHFVIYSNAQTISDRIALAKNSGIAGIALFKIDGKEDSNVWSRLAH